MENKVFGFNEGGKDLKPKRNNKKKKIIEPFGTYEIYYFDDELEILTPLIFEGLLKDAHNIMIEHHDVDETAEMGFVINSETNNIETFSNDLACKVMVTMPTIMFKMGMAIQQRRTSGEEYIQVKPKQV